MSKAKDCNVLNYNLACIVYRHSLATPDALAVVSGECSATYGEMANRAAQLAECLKQSQTWSNQDKTAPRVGILGSRSVDACIALIGACWAGATYIPIGIKLPEERILTLLSLCNLTAIIADTEGAKLLSEKVLDVCPPLVIAPHTDALHIPDGCRIDLVDIESLSSQCVF